MTKLKIMHFKLSDFDERFRQPRSEHKPVQKPRSEFQLRIRELEVGQVLLVPLALYTEDSVARTVNLASKDTGRSFAVRKVNHQDGSAQMFDLTGTLVFRTA